VLAAVVIADAGSKTLSYGPAPLLSAIGPFFVVALAAFWLGGRGVSESGFAYCAMWGGLVAILAAGILNTLVDRLASYAVEPVDGMTWPAVILAAPIFEEFFKTQPLRGRIKRDTKMVHTAIAYVWVSAAGFALVENMGYFTEALDGAYNTGFGEMVLLRSGLSMFAHSAFSTPAAIGAVYGKKARWIGLAISIVLHGTWNGMALSGVPLLTWYLIGAVPVFIVVMGVALWYRVRGERKTTLLLNESGYVPGVTEVVPGAETKLSWRQRRAHREWQSSVVRVLDGAWDLESLHRTSLKRREFAATLLNAK
jgi:RsiW-degrading membrane proteinase PrsW (M82 family)